VSSPDALALSEARFFADFLTSQGMYSDALVLNRVRPVPGESSASALAQALATQGVVWQEHAVERIAQALAEERELAARERAELANVAGWSNPVLVPALPADAHSVDSLVSLSEHLLNPG
jgi:hypothetical protein